MIGGLDTFLKGPAPAEPGLCEKDIQDALGPRYEALSLVGAGASALVFKVADLAADREVRAAKLTCLDRSPQAGDAVEAARAEFALASRLSHPNLARYFDLDIPPEGRFAVTTMEFVDGAPFGPALTQRDAGTACELMVQLLRGLQFLHDAGFVHGDVKPGNVLCGISAGLPWAKLLDFHLALPAGGAAGAKSRGTLRYMAPEVIAGAPPEARSDLYSAGVLFHEALSGEPLFDGTPQDVAARHLVAPVAQAAGVGALGRVIERLLSKHPDGRYPSASEALAAVAAAAGRGWLAETRETLLGRVRSAPLVGRNEALDKFAELLRPMEGPNGSAKVCLVRGRPGLGKTRLLREYQVRAQWSGLRTLFLGRTETAVGLLDRIDHWLGWESAGHGPVGVEQDMAGNISGVSDGVPTSREAGRIHLSPVLMSRSDATTDQLIAVGTRRRLAVFLDDVDELPADALECILFLIRGTRHSSVLFSLAVSDTTEQSALQGALEAWRHEGSVVEISLDELSLDDRRRLIQGALPGTTPPMAIDGLAEGCGGSPEVLILTLQHLVASGRLAMDASGRMQAADDLVSSLPESLTQLSSQIVESVDAGARNALELLAAAGGDVDADVLASAAKLDAGALLYTMQNGPASALVSFRRTDQGTLCKLQHAYLAESVLGHVSRGKTQALHDKLADAMEHPSGPGSAGATENIARHRLQGKSRQEGVRLALGWLVGRSGKSADESDFGLARMALRHARGADRTRLLEVAGDLALARGAFSEAADLFRKALRASHPPGSEGLRLRRKLGMAYVGAGDIPRARRALGKVAGAAAAAGGMNMAEVGYANLALGRACLYESRVGHAVKNCETAAAIGRELGDEHLVAGAFRWMGEAYLVGGEMEDSRGAFLEALQRFRNVADPMGIGASLAAVGYTEMLRQDWQSSVSCLEEALRHLRPNGYVTQAAEALSNLGAVNQKLCAWDRATENYDEALVLYERLGYARGQSAVLLNLSQVNASRGWLELAIAQAEDALQIAGTDSRLRCHAMNRMARAQYALGDLAAARETSESAADLATASDLQVPLESAYRTLGEIEVLQGQLAAAEEHLQSALALCRRSGSSEREAVCVARLAEVAIASGDVDSAHRLADSACARAATLPQGVAKAVTHTVKGRVLLAMGDAGEALGELLKADEFFSRSRVWDELTEVSLHLARAYLRLGRLRFAAVHCRTALDTVEQVASHLQCEEHKALFLTDPRRRDLYQVASELRQVAEQSTGHSSGAHEHGVR